MSNSDLFDLTQKMDGAAVPDGGAAPSDIPEQIGRYRVERLLGMGGFGLVYLAQDEVLNRPVAIKVPHDSMVSGPEVSQLYLAEARTVANLNHPNIAAVYDAGTTDKFSCYIVSMYVDGASLSAIMKQRRFAYTAAAELVATVAAALHYAHSQGLVHRDVKPGNILIGSDGTPYIVDFGLALKDQSPDLELDYSETPAYMSPEQACGEGHRVDERSDIFSLGVVLYELLVALKPFRGDSIAELLNQVQSCDPRPPRQFDESLPGELERICQKAMEKRASDRYSSAYDLAEDLRHFLADQTASIADIASSSALSGAHASGQEVAFAGDSSAASSASAPLVTPGITHPVVIMPKGLRSFDAHDADFFPALLPGPRDREGLPDSLRFWKKRIEETDSGRSFSVGLIYGPSGCGKSSFVKAGLLPLLSRNVVTVYIEATSDDTESRLLIALRRHCPDVSQDLSLRQTFIAIRRGYGIRSGRKLLIILDQFEQWLHATREKENSELVQALRQCDGSRIQCVVMVRDDFWIAVSRFFRVLEIRIVEGENSTLSDLFDLSHAEKVLAEFGRAFGKLPENSRETSPDQQNFIQQAVAGLQTDGKVISVRLALFAEMMKSRPWTPSALMEVGGATGVGTTFLEETFSAATAPPKHRYHGTAARAVLKALLPESGTDIKGQMKSWDELRQAAGHLHSPNDFENLVRILDNELHLITPVDFEGLEPGNDAAASTVTDRKYYQLTHDYLVHSLWQWLTRKQKETRRGRAEICLAECSSLWNARPEPRQLPTLMEYLKIRLVTDPTQWSTPEKKLLHSATRHHFKRLGGLAALLLIGAITAWQVFSAIQARHLQAQKQIQEQMAINQAATLVHRLNNADIQSVPGIIAELEPWRQRADPLLAEGFEWAAKGSRQKLNYALAMAPAHAESVKYLTDLLPELTGTSFNVVRQELLPYREIVSQSLWSRLEDSNFDDRILLPTAMALAIYAPDDERWNDMAARVAVRLTKVTAAEQYLEELAPVAAQLIAPFQRSVQDASLPTSERRRAAAALCWLLSVEQQSAEQLPAILVEWILETDDVNDFQRLLVALRPHAYGVQQKMRATIETAVESRTPERAANAALVLFYFGQADHVWPLLQQAADPSVRSLLIDRLTQLGTMRSSASHQIMAAQLVSNTDASIRQAIILIFGGLKEVMSSEEQQHIVTLLERLYVDDADAGVHSAVRWTLRQWHLDSRLLQLDAELSSQYAPTFTGERNWTINSIGQMLIRIAHAAEFPMGDPSTGKPSRREQIDYAFAVSACEVTVAEYLNFRPEYSQDIRYGSDKNCPVNNVSWYDAVAFCNWLSDKEGLTRCYEYNSDFNSADGVVIPEDFLQRSGYRLPTETEWECFCRSGTDSTYSFGATTDLSNQYVWQEKNSRNRTWPVGSKLPNIWGAFDTHGNVWEWSQSLNDVAGRASDRIVTNEHARLLCGGAFDNAETRVHSSARLIHFPNESKYSYGFRPVRSLPATHGK